MDNLYFFITAVTAFFALLVVVLVIFSAIKYRDSIPLELGWSIVPFFVSMVIFAWATIMFFH